jgi:hypothetical protein
LLTGAVDAEGQDGAEEPSPETAEQDHEQ